MDDFKFVDELAASYPISRQDAFAWQKDVVFLVETYNFKREDAEKLIKSLLQAQLKGVLVNLGDLLSIAKFFGVNNANK